MMASAGGLFFGTDLVRFMASLSFINLPRFACFFACCVVHSIGDECVDFLKYVFEEPTELFPLHAFFLQQYALRKAHTDATPELFNALTYRVTIKRILAKQLDMSERAIGFVQVGAVSYDSCISIAKLCGHVLC